MTIRAIIVDDEPLAREGLRHLLAQESDVEVVAECGDGRHAIAAVREHAPDLLVLDVQMPEVDGFGVVEELAPQNLPALVFVTAHDQHAVAAFEVHALDYVLKPVAPDRFRKAIERARALILQRRSGDVNERVLEALADWHRRDSYLQRLLIKTGGRVVFLKVDDVDWIEAAGNYLRLHAGKERHVVRQTMAKMEQQVDPKRFARIHRSTIVNLERVKEIQPWFQGDQIVVMQDGTQLPLSRSYREKLHERLGMSL